MYVALTTERAPVVPLRESDDPTAFLPVYLDREIAVENHLDATIKEYTLTREHRGKKDAIYNNHIPVPLRLA